MAEEKLRLVCNAAKGSRRKTLPSAPAELLEPSSARYFQNLSPTRSTNADCNASPHPARRQRHIFRPFDCPAELSGVGASFPELLVANAIWRVRRLVRSRESPDGLG